MIVSNQETALGCLIILIIIFLLYLVLNMAYIINNNITFYIRNAHLIVA